MLHLATFSSVSEPYGSDYQSKIRIRIPQSLTYTSFWAPPVVSGSMGLNRGLRICIYKFPDDAEVAGLGSTLGELLH